MADPNFEGMSAADLEKHIQSLGLEVDALRARQRRAHDWLEVRQQQEHRLYLESRPGNVPATQIVVPGALQLGAREEEK